MKHTTTIPTATQRSSARHPPISRLRAALAELAPDTIEQIAQRVAELLQHHQPQPAHLIDANELARRTGLTRAWIYEHADLLGAIRIGAGPKPRLRFDPDQIAATLLTPTSKTPTPQQTPRPRRRPPQPAAGDVELLPIRGRHGRGLLSRTRIRCRSNQH